MKQLTFLRRSNTITGRIITSFLISTLIPTVIIIAILCAQFEKNFNQTAQDQMQLSGSLAANLLGSQFDNMDTITMTPYYSSYFSARKPMSITDTNYQARYMAFQNEMQQLFDLTTYSSSDIADLVVWSDGIAFYHILFNERWYPIMLRTITEQPWFEHALATGGRMAFSPGTDSYFHSNGDTLDTSAFYITRQIRNLRNPSQTNMVILRVSTTTLGSQLENLDLVYDSFIVITNEKDELIYSSRPLTQDGLACALSNQEYKDSEGTWKSSSFSLDKYDLTIHVIYSLNELHQQIFTMMLTAVLLYLTGLLAAYLLFRQYNHWITSSVTSLLDTFARIEEGDLETHCRSLDVEEFDMLSQSVNEMIDRLNEKIRSEYLMTIRQKSLQLYALQSQIQPHFLTNTIYCFIALNQLGMRAPLNSALYSLSHLLRYVLSKERYTTIGKEYDFLTDYLKLQKLRFEDRLSYELRCDEALRKVQIPRLLLQPLVENAIIHGIEPSEHPCTCSLSCEQKDERLILRIVDDGVGFDQAEFDRKLAEAAAAADDPTSEAYCSSTREKSSIGLYYVRERLRMWSDQANLSIRRIGNLSIAELTIPMEVIQYETSGN